MGIVIGDTGPEIREAVGDGSRWGISITYIEQDAPLGLAHAVKISRDFLGDDRFVMFLGDNVIEGGIHRLIVDFDQHTEWHSQIVLTRVEQPEQYGVAKLTPDGRIERLIEKPKEPPSDLALVGIYMFDAHVFEATDAIQPSWRGELEITDAIQWLVEHDYLVYPHIHEGWWIDTGRPNDMLEANSMVLHELKPEVLGSIDAESEVDARVTIQAGAEIINSTIRGPAIIGENTRIVNSYIGPYTSIYHDVTVENCEIDRSIVLEHSVLRDIDVRIQDSLIGRYTLVQRTEVRPRAIKLNLGDYSKAGLL